MAKYEFEIWNSVDVHTMDITPLVQNVRYSLERNAPQALDFDMDLEEFETLCKSIGEDARIALRPYTTDIKVKRDGQYLFGVQVAELTPRADDRGPSVTVSCDGFLNLVADRYVNLVQTQVETSQIAWNLINMTNIVNYPGGDTGITKGTLYDTGILRDRTYEYQNVKEGVVNLTSLESETFDLEITHERVFNTYQYIGSDRPDITISYPASETGIPAISMELPRVARGTLYNWIIAFGSGFGHEALTTSAGSPSSAETFGVRQMLYTQNDISVLSTLEEHTIAELTRRFDILRMPRFTVSGSDFDLNDIKIGDRIKAHQHKYSLLYVDGTYRIERLEVTLDENFEETIVVTLDEWTQ